MNSRLFHQGTMPQPAFPCYNHGPQFFPHPPNPSAYFNPAQLEMFRRARMMRYMELQSMYLHPIQTLDKKAHYNLKLESPMSSCHDDKSLAQTSPPMETPINIPMKMNIPIKAEPVQVQVQPKPVSPVQAIPEYNFAEQNSAPFEMQLRSELRKMIDFVLDNMGNNRQTEIEEARKIYANNTYLSQIYDKLVIKYFSAKKCKEDIVRYIMRKVLKIMKTNLKKTENVSGKRASLKLCKKYFSSNFEKIEAAGVNLNNEDELVELFMPYRKNSRNKTMNTSFVLEVFSSPEFCQEYESFLSTFDEILLDDNEKKIVKLIDYIIDLIKSNQLSKLGTYNRLPWLNVWNEDTKNIAISLMPGHRYSNPIKKLKVQDF